MRRGGRRARDRSADRWAVSRPMRRPTAVSCRSRKVRPPLTCDERNARPPRAGTVRPHALSAAPVADLIGWPPGYRPAYSCSLFANSERSVEWAPLTAWGIPYGLPMQALRPQLVTTGLLPSIVQQSPSAAVVSPTNARLAAPPDCWPAAPLPSSSAARPPVDPSARERIVVPVSHGPQAGAVCPRRREPHTTQAAAGHRRKSLRCSPFLIPPAARRRRCGPVRQSRAPPSPTASPPRSPRYRPDRTPQRPPPASATHPAG